MKTLLIIFAVLAFAGCGDDAPTESKIDLNKEYTLEELENDPDWVEITDIDTVMINPCISFKFTSEGTLIRNAHVFDSLVSETVIKNGEPDFEKYFLDTCYNSIDDFNIDTNSKSLILFSAITNKGPKITRKVFKHKIQDYLIYYNRQERVSGNEGNNLYNEIITVPKTKEVQFIIINFKD